MEKNYKIFIGKWIKSPNPTEYIRKFEFTIKGNSKKAINELVDKELRKINQKSQFNYAIWVSKTQILKNYNFSRYSWDSWLKLAKKQLGL